MSRPANIFELLQDENDSEVKKAPTSVKEQPKKAPTNAQPAKTQQKAVERSGEGKGPSRPKSDQPRERRPPQQRDGSAAPTQFDGERRNRPPRQQVQGEGRERRDKQAEKSDFENPKHRAFERKSGTGRGKEQKRGGAGRANWGTVEDDQKAQVEATPEQQVTEENAEQQQSAEAKPEATPEVVAQPAEPNPEDEEDAKLKTLDDYRKTLKAPTVALPPPRVVEDKGEWSKYTALKREEDQTPQKKASKKEEKEESESAKKTIRADEVLKFTEGSPKDRDRRDNKGGFRRERGGKDFSPRGGGRGTGKRGGPRGTSSAPNFSDERSFPSLSTATKA